VVRYTARHDKLHALHLDEIFLDHKIGRGVRIHTAHNTVYCINSYVNVAGTAHYHIILISQHYNYYAYQL